MVTKELMLEAVYRSLSKLGLPEALERLHQHNVTIQRYILGGSHSVVTYPPLNSLYAVNGQSILSHIQYGKTVNLYVHIAFCETLCTFCHYAVDHYRGKDASPERQITSVARYLKALHKELKSYAFLLRTSGTQIASIYIGGGTPLVLEYEQLQELLTLIRSEFDVLPNAEICIEASPLTITAVGGESKLERLAQNGATRLSFGIQSFNNQVLRFAARGYDRELAIRACTLAGKHFNNWNLDLIQSLYKGGTDEVWDNLVTLEQVQPPHLTYYHGRFAERPQGAWLSDDNRKAGFEDEWETLVGRMLIWESMQSLGYRQTDGNRFVLSDKFVDPFKQSRTSVNNSLLGVGASSYSHFAGTPTGWFFRNQPNINLYVDQVEESSYAIKTGRELTPEEMLAASYVIGLRTGRTEAQSDLQEVSRHYDELVLELQQLGLLELSDSQAGQLLKLSRLGQLFEDELLARFYSPSVQVSLQET